MGSDDKDVVTKQLKRTQKGKAGEENQDWTDARNVDTIETEVFLKLIVVETQCKNWISRNEKLCC